MDIVSLGKASKVLRDVQKLDGQVVAPSAESHFSTVDARLDWLEAQAALIRAESVATVDLTKKIFDNTQNTQGYIQLKALGEAAYVGEGTWESDVVDLGGGWQDTVEILVDIDVEPEEGRED